MEKVSVSERFWGKVAIGANDECWMWTFGKYDRGYGMFWSNGKNEGAHRVAWRLTRGDIPRGAYVCHHCDNPSCVNPNHLFLGTQADNVHDMIRKGRADFSNITMVNSCHKNRGHSKLTENDVLEIVELGRAGDLTQTEIAKKYGVSQAQINNILLRKQWVWLIGINKDAH